MKADELEQRLKNALIYGTSHPEAYMTKTDELWEKYQQEAGIHMLHRTAFLAALKEYGQHVKAEAVKVCRERGEKGVSKWSDSELEESKKSDAWECLQCAAAIEKMPLP